MGGPVITKRRKQDPNDPESSSQDQDSDVLDTPLFPLNSQELFRIMKIFLKSGLPTSISFMCGFISGLVCFRFAGKYGTPSDLAGATLGFTWSNVFCVGILSSINQGFSILAAQLYGARKYHELGILLQKNIFVLVIVMIPLLLSLCFADVILLAIGLNHEVSIATGLYLKFSIPSVLGLAVFECLKYYLIAQNYFYLQPITQGSLSIVHIFWCYLFVDVFGMPVAGVALAKSITDVCTALMLFLCVKWTGICRDTWVPWNKSSLERWWPYLKQTLILGANLYIEWMALEMSLFVAGMLNDEYILGAQGIAVTVMNVFFMLPLGNSVSMQAYIGNAAGEGSKNKAQKFMFVGLCINLILTSMNTLIMLIWSDNIAEFFTNDVRTKEILATMISIYAFAHIADTNVSHLSGVLRSLGNEWKVLISFLTCYMIIAVNCEWIFAAAMGLGYKAIWYSMGVGMYLMFAWSVKKVLTLNWEQEIEKIRENHQDEKYTEMVEI